MNKSFEYCPASVTLIFKVHKHQDPLKMGSTGVGFTIDKGVTATLTRSEKTTIKFNGDHINFPTVEYAIKQLSNQCVDIALVSPLPLGCGFGLSGASALAILHALNKLLSLKKTKQQILKIAYLAEVLNKTGLGTVTTQSIGGFLFKQSPGINPKYSRFPFIGKKIYCIVLSKIETPTILKNEQSIETINKTADKYLSKISKINTKSLTEIFNLSYLFARDAKLITDKETQKIIKQLHDRGLPATITMLGNVVLTTQQPTKSKGFEIKELSITNQPATRNYI